MKKIVGKIYTRWCFFHIQTASILISYTMPAKSFGAPENQHFVTKNGCLWIDNKYISISNHKTYGNKSLETYHLKL